MEKQQLRLPVRISQKLERTLGGEHVYLLALAAIVGILGGFGAVLFRKMIELVNTVVNLQNLNSHVIQMFNANMATFSAKDSKKYFDTSRLKLAH